MTLLNETTTELVEGTEPAEKVGNTIMVSEIFFTLDAENLQFNCDR